jgi:hypothetical protein
VTQHDLVRRGRRLIPTLALGAVLAVSLAFGSVTARTSSGPSTAGSCSVSPASVARLADYTVTGTSLGANTIVRLWVTDASGTTAWSLQTDATGTTAVTWHSYVTGTSTATFYTSSGRKSTTLASCSFSVY